MTTFDVSKLLSAIDNENNESILHLSSNTIKTRKNDILQKLNLPRHTLLSMHKGLKGYRYIDELNELNYGCFVRWIDLTDPTRLKLTNGGIVCDMKPTDDDILVVCKNLYGRFFQFHFNKSLIFQKLTNQEKILLIAMDHLS